MDKKLRTYAEDKGWMVDSSIVSADLHGYLFTISKGGRILKLKVPLIHITDEFKSRVISFLDKRKNELNLREYGFNDSVLFFHVNEASSLLTEDELDLFLSNFSNFFKTNNIGTEQYCVFCGLEDPDDQCTLNKVQFHTHSYCYKHYLKSKRKTRKDFANRNYLLGTLGAFIGGLVGVIPWLIVNYIGFFTSFLGYVIGIASLNGYKLLGGKYGFKTRWIILICVLFSVVFAELISYLIFMGVEGINFSLYNYVNLIQYNLSSFIINIGLGIVFALLGIYHLFKE